MERENTKDITPGLLLEYEKQNLTLQEIGDIYGISRERVRQIYWKILKRKKLRKTSLTIKTVNCRTCNKPFETNKKINVTFCSIKCKVKSPTGAYYLTSEFFTGGIRRYGSVATLFKNQNKYTKGSFWGRWYRIKKQNLIPKDVLDIVDKNHNRFFTHEGKKLNLSQWAKEKNINKHVLASRINSGWALERALTTPIRRRIKK